jgi:hypothetical protein|tara:strand:+ start:592 stop:861 length:270 start_codon:yes stop_codon:yes gene_type:complete
LKEIFVYYASFGDRLNTENLKSAKFHKMLQDAGIMSFQGMSSPKGLNSIRNTSKLQSKSDVPLMNKKRIDLIFCAVNKHKPFMSFDIFL